MYSLYTIVYQCIPLYTLVITIHVTLELLAGGPKSLQKNDKCLKLPLTPAPQLVAPIYPPKLSFPLAKVDADWCQVGWKSLDCPPPPSTRFIPLFSDPSQIIDIWVIRRKLTTELGDWKLGRIVVAGGKHPECAHDSVRNFWAQSLHKMMGILKIHIWYQYECFYRLNGT